MKTFRWLAGSALALVAVPLLAAPTGTFSPQRLSQHVQTLGSDAFEGRGVNTRAETKTVDYIVSQLQAAGVQPGGDLVNGQRKWTQDVPLFQSDIVGTPQLSLNLGNGQRIALTQGEQIAVRSPSNGQTTVNLANAPLLFVGYGVTAPERNWDDFKGQDVRGKLLVVLVNDPDFEGGEGDFGGKAMTYYGRWTYKYEEAARKGAAGVLIVHETAPASYGWNTVKNSNTNTMFDIVRQNPASEHTAFESWIQRPLAEQIFAASGLNFDQAKAQAKLRGFQPIPLKATLSANVQAKTETITSHNVVGILPGKKHPDETVIYTAHWDHLGIGKPDANGDNIYNGALDNSTGISHLIEQARAFAKGPRPDRSVVFLAVTAEEKGLLGSEYYAANPLYPLAKTVGVLNTDSMGVWGPAKNFSISGTAKLGLLDDLIAEGKTQGRYFTADPHPESGGFYRSDHFSFAKVGVPAISFKSGNDLVNGGTARGEAIARDYTAKRYHQPDDEYQPDWDFRGQAEDAQLLHMVGERLANSREWPNWSSDSEFRATRDQSGAERAGAGGERG
ncbi:M28 family metallopeptidase [Sphingomonas sp. SM33]|uniref:M28 family metallopeptidase n=1 Tax=Sphingomonas telluris TaxID=2907998 RepID=A0ABS9VLU0_9SPHN|nr:M28 family metallopeptidase [Sphingomonas telluris]MCH8615936.1 M28 family metallopeptidase [Sphingomonas telluris]